MRKMTIGLALVVAMAWTSLAAPLSEVNTAAMKGDLAKVKALLKGNTGSERQPGRGEALQEETCAGRCPQLAKHSMSRQQSSVSTPGSPVMPRYASPMVMGTAAPAAPAEGEPAHTQRRGNVPALQETRTLKIRGTRPHETASIGPRCL